MSVCNYNTTTLYMYLREDCWSPSGDDWFYSISTTNTPCNETVYDKSIHILVTHNTELNMYSISDMIDDMLVRKIAKCKLNILEYSNNIFFVSVVDIRKNKKLITKRIKFFYKDNIYKIMKKRCIII